MPNFQGIWSLSEQYQNAAGWPIAPLGAGFALFIGGSDQNVIDYVNISTSGNATDFGDLAFTTENGAVCSSETRAFYFGGQKNNAQAPDIVFVTYTIGSATTDFGDQSPENSYTANPTALSNSTRGVVAGGSGANSPFYLNTVAYITMSTASNSTDFGDLTQARESLGAFSSTTRGCFAGGTNGSVQNTVDYITIASVGSATDFGDLSVSRRSCGALASSTRGVVAGGFTSVGVNVIDYMTIASAGNATDFGDFNANRYSFAGSGASNKTTGLFAGGVVSSAVNTIEYITIASAGNATDFGDLTTSRSSVGSVSNAHGGL